jgi:hypothetical protein
MFRQAPHIATPGIRPRLSRIREVDFLLDELRALLPRVRRQKLAEAGNESFKGSLSDVYDGLVEELSPLQSRPRGLGVSSPLLRFSDLAVLLFQLTLKSWMSPVGESRSGLKMERGRPSTSWWLGRSRPV